MPETEYFQEKAKRIVGGYAAEHLDKSDPTVEFDVFVVWFSKTLQNWKALLSTTLPDTKYYEVTYNGDKREAYLDVYLKVENQAIKDVSGLTADQIHEELNS